MGAYPNMFFVVLEDEIEVFSTAVARLKSAADYERLVETFGIRRDRMKNSGQSTMRSTQSISPATPCALASLDLTRYSLVEK